MSRLQFSVRRMLIGTAGIAVAAWALTMQPFWPAIVAIVTLSVFLTTMTIWGVIASTGRLKLLWLGIAVTIAVASVNVVEESFWLLSVPDSMPDDREDYIRRLQYGVCFYWCLAPINGLLCFLVHHLSSQRQPTPTSESQISKATANHAESIP